MKGFSPEEELIHVIQNGNEEAALHLIDSGKVDINYKDKRGFTPLVYAHRNRLQKVVKSLYDHHATPTSEQLSVMNKMCRIIFDIPGENPYLSVNEIINYAPSFFPEDETVRIKKSISRALHNGLCYGFSGLMLYMFSKGKGPEFSAIQQEIVKWDGEDTSLANFAGLKEIIRHLFDNVYFLSWAHSSLTDEQFILEMQNPNLPKIERKDLDAIINLVLDPKESKYQREFNFLFTFRAEELSFVFDKVVFPHKMVRLNFNHNHWVSIFQDKEGYHFYDPESTDGPLLFQNTKDLAQAVTTSYQRYFSQFNEIKFEANSLYDIGIYVYDKVDAKKQHYPEKEALLDEILQSRGSHKMIDEFSAEGMYNALSLADSFRDKEMVTALLQRGADAQVKNKLGFTMLSPETQEMARNLEKTPSKHKM